MSNRQNSTNPPPDPLDHAALDTLRQLENSGSAGLVARVVKKYLESGDGLMQGINQALAVGDAEAMREAAHSLKSSSANVGGRYLASLCQQLEDAVRGERAGALRDLGRRIDTEYGRVVHALKQMSATG